MVNGKRPWRKDLAQHRVGREVGDQLDAVLVARALLPAPAGAGLGAPLHGKLGDDDSCRAVSAFPAKSRRRSAAAPPGADVDAPPRGPRR